MNGISAYTDNKERRWRVTVGRQTVKGFKAPLDALRKGIDLAMQSDPRVSELVKGKPLKSQVGIVFGADIRDRYFNQGGN